MRLLFLGILFLIFLSSSQAAITQVSIRMQWEYKDFDSAVRSYEVKEGVKLWETRNVSSIKEVPVTTELRDGSFTLAPGESKRFAIIIQNNQPNPLYFFAAPHQTSPVENSLGSKIKCLCIGRSYMINQNETWYRVLEFRLARDYVGKELIVTHSIIGIDEKRAKAFFKNSDFPDF